MKIIVQIETSNAAFADHLEGEVGDVLRKLARNIESGYPVLTYNMPDHAILDSNGNTIGALKTRP